MLTDAEYCQVTGFTQAELDSLTPEEELFTQFDFDLGSAVNRNGSPMFPELNGEYVSLFTVKPNRPKELSETDELQRREQERQVNLAKYIKRGFAFEAHAEGHKNDY